MASRSKIEPNRPGDALIGMEAVLDQSPPTLAHLVAAARRGDRDAFRALVEPDLPAALGTARIVTRSEADASDAVQEALLSAWRGLDGLREPEAFRAWFRRHVVRAALRAASRRGRVVELDLTASAPEGELDRALEQRTLGRAFARLDPPDRLLLTLHHFWGLPIAETAAHLDIPEGTVKSRVHYAMDRLRAAYAAEERR
ncbi:MAG TPA: sigma-70 family RNA polymerase sigma factor [Candidatus Limnocylindrales bacterium]|nr:sigma-70 family RNA polymerase sigma factor [Candidatus Limnocylindrales bacterium]